MPGPYVLDASVFLNAFLSSEKDSDISKEMLLKLRAAGSPLVAPLLLLPETAAALSRGQNDPGLARSFAETLQHYPHLIWIALDQLLAGQAVNIAAAYRLRGSDAVYAAVAQQFACPLITLDREQHDRAAGLLQTYYPAEVLALISP